MQTRHDPYFYLPKFVRLEARVGARSTARLRDYVKAMSGGSTPKKEEEDKYYADSTSGIPFVRVQNLNVDGHLSLADVKYVNLETHEGLLNRSKVLQDDLLVKITGVGRMAVASVPPLGFEGNINQHIARIRTESRETSEALAAWLNTDIAETLAKRRSTGGTRPALDYPALRSMPVILDAQVQKELSDAYARYKQAEAKANELLAGIDDYLLSELGITLPPEPENTIANRIFTVSRKSVSSGRVDPYRYSGYQQLLRNAVYASGIGAKELRKCIAYHVGGNWGIEEPADDERQYYTKCLVIRNTEFDNRFNLSIEGGREAYRFLQTRKLERMDVQPFDILVEKSGGSPDQPVGRVAILLPDLLEKHSIGFSNFLCKLRPCTDSLDPMYLFFWLKTAHRLRITESMQAQTNGIRNLIMSEYLDQLIPVPELPIQAEIAKGIAQRMNKAQVIRSKAEIELRAAKRRAEAMLLGEEPV